MQSLKMSAWRCKIMRKILMLKWQVGKKVKFKIAYGVIRIMLLKTLH